MPATIKIVIEGINDADAAFKDAARGIDDLGKKAKDGGGGFNALREIAVGALRAIGEAAVNAAAAGVQAMAGFVKDSIGAAGNFEGAVNGLAAVAGGALESAGISMDDVRNKALQLGKDTAFSAQQSIDAMTALAKGGVPVVDIMGAATDATLALAAASGTDLAKAADIVAKQLGVWAKTGVDAAQVTDLLAAAANASTVDVEELGLGLANAGGTAQVAGVSFQDLVQTMGLIAPNFSSAADAGTSLKTFISRLVPVTDSQTQAMMALNLATEDGSSVFFDAQGNFVGMSQAAQLLHDALAPLPKDQQLVALNTIFGSDAIRAAAAIADAGAEGYDAFGQAMADTGGAAAAAATMQQGYNFQMEQFGGSVETLQITLGSALLPLLTDLMARMTEGVNVALLFTQAVTGNTDAFSQLSPAMQEVATWVQTSLIPAMTNLYNWLSVNLPIALQNLASFWTNTLQPALSQVWGFIQGSVIPVITDLYNWLSVNLPIALQNLSVLWTGTLQPALNIVWSFITGSVIPAITDLHNWLSVNLPIATQNLAAIWTNNLQPALRDVQDLVENHLIPLWNTIADVFQTEATPESEALGAAVKQIGDFLASQVNPAVQGLIDLASMIPGPFREAASLIRDFHGALQAAKDGADSLARGIRAVADALNSLPSSSSIGGVAGIGAGLVTGKASGGPISAGQIVPVGEHGRELFVPSQNGSIVNNSQATNNYFNYSPTYSATPSSPIADFAMMRSLAGV